MSIYELDDDLVRKLVETTYAPDKMDAARAVADQLKDQLPIPAPAKVGAVVRTVGGVYVRAQTDNEQLMEWLLTEEGLTEESSQEHATKWSSTGQLPRIIEVLSEGVDL